MRLAFASLIGQLLAHTPHTNRREPRYNDERRPENRKELEKLGRKTSRDERDNWTMAGEIMEIWMIGLSSSLA